MKTIQRKAASKDFFPTKLLIHSNIWTPPLFYLLSTLAFLLFSFFVQFSQKDTGDILVPFFSLSFPFSNTCWKQPRKRGKVWDSSSKGPFIWINFRGNKNESNRSQVLTVTKGNYK